MSTQTYVNQATLHQDAMGFLDRALNQVDRLIKHSYNNKQYGLNNDECADALNYHFLSPGQKVRARICLDACVKLNVAYDDMIILAAVAELLHNASLIHDDIQDEDEIRRGQATVWKKFNTSIAICAGDLLLSNAYGVLANFSQPQLLPKLISAINSQTKCAIDGQSKDIAYKDKQAITIDEYLQIAAKKSGALLCLPLELALIAAQKSECIEVARKACDSFAIGYQIADDLEDSVKDFGSYRVSKSVNITFILKDLGHPNIAEEAARMCQQYLDEAMIIARKLPNDSGFILLSLANVLKNRIKCL